MVPQAYGWTCSVCSCTWVLQAMNMINTNASIYDVRNSIGEQMGYPNCVNETYGCMSSDCVVRLFGEYDLLAVQEWVSYDQAYSIAGKHTGVINPVGMQHYMAIRGQDGPNIWVANSASGYRGIYDILDRSNFNALGPVQVIYIEGRY